MYREMDEDQVHRVCRSVRSFVKSQVS
jgi:hypothetical protein